MLIHDAGHTSAREAAEIGKMAGVGRLYLIHYGEANGDNALTEAREIFPATFLAKEGETITL